MSAVDWRLAISVQAGLVQAAWTGVRLMIGYRALGLGADPFFLALLSSSLAMPAVLVALPAGRLTDRIGGTAVATAGMFIGAVGSICGFLLPGLPTLLAVTVCIGLGQILIMVGQQTFVANASAHTSSDAAFGNLSASASMGQLVGPPLVTVVASLAVFGGEVHPNTTVGLMVCAALVLLATPIYFVLAPVDRTLQSARLAKDESPAQVSELLKTPGLWRALAVGGAVLVTVDLMYAFLPLWAVEQGVPATAVGFLLALRALVSVLSRFGLARLVSRFGRKALILVSMTAAAAGLLALPFVGIWGAVIVMIGLGLGVGIPQPLTMAWMTSLTPPASHGATLGMRLTSNRVAQIVLPLAAGAFAAPLGVVGIFWANAVLLTGAIGLMARSTAGKSDP